MDIINPSTLADDLNKFYNNNYLGIGTQVALAKHLGVHPSTISRLLNYKADRISLTKARQICEKLGWDLDGYKESSDQSHKPRYGDRTIDIDLDLKGFEGVYSYDFSTGITYTGRLIEQDEDYRLEDACMVPTARIASNSALQIHIATRRQKIEL